MSPMLLTETGWRRGRTGRGLESDAGCREGAALGRRRRCAEQRGHKGADDRVQRPACRGPPSRGDRPAEVARSPAATPGDRLDACLAARHQLLAQVLERLDRRRAMCRPAPTATCPETPRAARRSRGSGRRRPGRGPSGTRALRLRLSAIIARGRLAPRPLLNSTDRGTGETGAEAGDAKQADAGRHAQPHQQEQDR